MKQEAALTRDFSISFAVTGVNFEALTSSIA
jgi:hypothetical protein